MRAVRVAASHAGILLAGALLIGASLAGTGCVGASPEADPVAGIDVAGGFAVEELVGGLDGPTQATHHPDGRLVVAELNGGENDGTGRVVAIELDGDRGAEVLVGNLDKPTGVEVLDGELWVMEQRRLSRVPLAGAGAGRPTVVLDDLAFNGRSETTLTATPDGTLLYGTTGSLAGGRPRQGSGVLWELDPATATPIAVSAGFKNAYGHTFGPDGRLWVTEISDGSFDGRPAPDELVEVTAGVDHGWPACVGDRTPVAEYGGAATSCAAGPPSQALFDPGATPTSVAVAPWDPDTLVVALWRERRVVTVPADPVVDPGAAGGSPHAPVDLLVGLETGDPFRPQHLLVDGDRLLVVDFDGGRILALAPA